MSNDAICIVPAENKEGVALDQIQTQRKQKLLAAFFIVALVFVAIAGFWIQQALYSNSQDGEVIIFEVKQGSSLQQISQELEAAEVIQNSTLFNIYAFINGQAQQLSAGTYELKKGSSIDSVVSKISAGEVMRDRYVFSIPEGSNIEQIAVAAEQQGFCSAEDFLSAVEESTLRPKKKGVKYALEGYLYPATYRFDTLPSPEELIDHFYSYGQLYYNQLEIPQDHPLTLDEVIILASILEKESQYDGERERVAGVFLNRLAIDMPLQSCATVQYILPETKELLSEEDTQIESPYNTYIHEGLPIGPISSPSLMAMQAVLTPEENDFYFFVADPQGRHIFTRTYNEHLAAIASLGD